MKRGLTGAERKNIRIRSNGRVELRNPNSINVQNASYAYQQIAGLVNNQNLTINVYSVTKGQTVNGASYQDAYNSNGITFGSSEDATRDVVIPVGGAAPVAGNPPGSGNTVPSTEDAIFAHEVFGHASGNDGDDAIAVENDYRKNRNPALGERSGEDHRFETTVTGNPPLPIPLPNGTIQTNITPRPLEPLPRPPKLLLPPPPKPLEEMLR